MATRKRGNKRKQMRLPVSVILTSLTILGSFYAYQYFMHSEINIIKVEARYSRETKDNKARVDLFFNIKNEGKSRTKNMFAYSAFLNWTVDNSGVKVAPI